MSVGKSTIAKILSKKLKLLQISIDALRYDLYKEIGYDENFVSFLSKNFGFWSVYLYWKEFECYSVEKIIENNKNSVIDLGAGHSVYENKNHLNRIKNSLKGHIVILLLPSKDINESFEILCNRLEIKRNEKDINLHFLMNTSNKELADFTVYTKNKTPNETCEEITSFIKNILEPKH